MRDHGVAATPWVLGVAERVVLGGGLGEPDITTVSTEVAVLERLGNILLDHNGTTGSVDQPRALLHLGDELLVEETARLLVERAVDGDNIALGQHLLEVLHTSAANLLLLLGRQRLVVKVEELLAVKRLETAEHTLSDAADSNRTDHLVLEIVLVLGHLSHVPLALDNLLVGGDKVADKGENGHDDVLSDGNDVGTSHLGDGDATVGLVGSVEIDMVRSNTSGNGELEVLRLGETLCGQVTGVESVNRVVLADARSDRVCAALVQSRP